MNRKCGKLKMRKKKNVWHIRRPSEVEKKADSAYGK